MNIDIMGLQCFLAVALTKSFTKASEIVGRTQSAVSQQIAKLEENLGSPLLIRGRTLSLTPKGEVFHTYAKRIIALHQDLRDRLQSPSLVGQVRFGLPEDFSSVFLADVLTDFMAVHPRILLNIECDLTLNLLNRFKKKEFDLVLVKMNRPEDFTYGREVWSEKLEWVGSKKYLETYSQHPQLLPLVLAPEPCVYRSKALKALEEAGLSWQIVFTSPSYSSTMAAVKAGAGLTVLPPTMIPSYLCALRHPLLPPLSDTHVSLLKHDAKDPVIQSFEHFVLQKLNPKMDLQYEGELTGLGGPKGN